MHNSTFYELGAILAGAAGEDPAAVDEASGLGSKVGVLPFTGVDLLILAGVALLVVAMGFLLRKLSAPRGPLSSRDLSDGQARVSRGMTPLS